MRALHRFFVNPFDARGISLSELLAFATDHFERLRARNTDGSLDERVAATEAALADLKTAFTGDLSGGAFRKARKMSKRQFRHDRLPGDLARVFAFVTAHFGPRSPEVRSLGRRKDYRRAPDDALDKRLRALHTAVAAHQATLGDAPVALAAGLVDDWAAIHQQSEGATGAKTRTESELRRARRALQWELYVNLLRLVERHPRDPDALRTYMQPHLLERRRRKAGAEGADGAEGAGDTGQEG